MDASNAQQPWKVGNRVRHVSRPEWGIGEILALSSSGEMDIFFDDIGFKKFTAAASSRFVLLRSEEANSEYLSRLIAGHWKRLNEPPRSTSGGRTSITKVLQSFQKLVEIFCSYFPEGFNDPDYLVGERNERAYKEEPSKLAREILSAPVLLQLVETRDFDTVVMRARSLVNKTTMVSPYEKIWLGNALQAESAKEKFSRALYASLYGENTISERFTVFADAMAELGCGKWPLVTYFFFLIDPANYIFLKPEVTKSAAEFLGFELNYRPEPNWLTYQSVLEMARLVSTRLRECSNVNMTPRDMIDVQSFIWVIAPGYF